MCLNVSREKGKRCLTFESLDPFRLFMEKRVEIRPQIYHLDSLCGLNFSLLATETQKSQKWRECIHAADTPMIRTKSLLNVCAEYTVKNTTFGFILAVWNARICKLLRNPGIDSPCLCSLAGRYDNPIYIPTRLRQIGLTYRPARLHRLAESSPWNHFPGSLKVSK